MTRLIDADALDALIVESYHMTEQEYVRAGYSIVRLLIDKVPTVDAVPVRHGKWTRENNYGIWKCSVCGCKVNRSNPLKGNIWNYYYCPNCGTRMDEE